MKVISNHTENILKIEINNDWLDEEIQQEELPEYKHISDIISDKMNQIYLENLKRKFLIKEISNYIKS